jgi:hypothetical protein
MRRGILSGFAMLFLALPLSADETADVYKLLYTQAETQRQKYIALKVMVDMNDPVLASVLAGSLKDMLVADTGKFGAQDKDYYGKALILACQGLGNFLYEDAQDDLMFLARNGKDPQARAEAVIALGKMKAVAYVAEIAGILRDLNANAASNRDDAEILANGCILSLGKMGDVRGWTDVFLASQGWYSNRIRFTAEEILASMVADPSSAVSEIVAKEALKLKILALRYETRSKASRDSRIAVYLLALRQGLAVKASVGTDKALAKSLRTAAVEGLVSQGESGPESLGLYRQFWPAGDTDERLLILSACGLNKSDECAELLSAALGELDSQKAGGAYGEELDRLAKAAVMSAARTKNAKTAKAIKAIAANAAWSSSILDLAKDALKSLGQ